jgi:hypothetical protein
MEKLYTYYSAFLRYYDELLITWVQLGNLIYSDDNTG